LLRRIKYCEHSTSVLLRDICAVIDVQLRISKASNNHLEVVNFIDDIVDNIRRMPKPLDELYPPVRDRSRGAGTAKCTDCERKWIHRIETSRNMKPTFAISRVHGLRA